MEKNYIQRLVTPTAKKGNARKVWSVDLEQVWLPFFVATNANGDTAIPHEAIGAPIRLAYNPDGTVKFSKSGKPVTKVAKELGEQIRNVRENFVAGLVQYASDTAEKNAKGVKKELELARKAGKPILDDDNNHLQEAIAAQMEAAANAAETESGSGDEVPAQEQELVTAQ